MAPGDAFDLERFVRAQAGVIDAALAELAAGRKRSHWMWFVFPQLSALGRSETARFYGIASISEARAFLAHPLLGPRLRASVGVVMAAPAPSLHALFGSPDDLKFRSSMTLFAVADGRADSEFSAALARWCDGVSCAPTLKHLGGALPGV